MSGGDADGCKEVRAGRNKVRERRRRGQRGGLRVLMAVSWPLCHCMSLLPGWTGCCFFRKTLPSTVSRRGTRELGGRAHRSHTPTLSLRAPQTACGCVRQASGGIQGYFRYSIFPDRDRFLSGFGWRKRLPCRSAGQVAARSHFTTPELDWSQSESIVTVFLPFFRL